MMNDFINFNTALYRRNNIGSPCVWYGTVSIIPNHVTISYGIMGKRLTTERIKTNRKPEDELRSRINSKRKTGYIYLSEVKDNTILPVEELHIISYLEAYLPYNRSNSNGAMLPMLAKLYDNTNNKLFKGGKIWIAQPKVNGLRCGIGAVKNEGDLFKPIRLTFQSRDGIYWDSLDNLEEYLLKEIPSKLLGLMVDEGYILDGELYLYGQTVNNINSYVKTPKMEANKKLQFWCYDIAIPDMSQTLRHDVLNEHLDYCLLTIDSKESHAQMDIRFGYLESYNCYSHSNAVHLRDMFIRWGFEGLILRDPDAEYQFGKRNSSMVKYKSVTDGVFTVIDVIPEGDKREGIPLLVLKNDINEATFKVHITAGFEYQKLVLKYKEKYIGTQVVVEYGERSGVEQVPFHVKTVTWLEE